MKLMKNVVLQARRQEMQPVIAFAGGVASYRVLLNSVSAMIDALKLLNLPAGSLVAIDIRNPIYHMATIYSLALLGITSASVSTVYATENSGPRPTLFLTDRDDVEAAGLTVRKVDGRWFAFDADQPVDYRKLLSMPGFTRSDEVVRYVYSSGTTGRAKCVALTVNCIETRLANYNMLIPRRGREGAFLNMMGFSTVMGTIVPFTAVPEGTTVCFASGYTDALQMIQLFGVSWMVVSVTQLEGILRVLGDQPPPPSLRRLFMGGSKCPARLFEEAKSRLCNNITSNYGSTEMGVVTIGGTHRRHHEGQTGFILPWIEVEAVDDSDLPVGAGQEGVLRVRTEEMAYYVDEQGRPIEMLRDGWFYPGDVGQIDDDGQLIITGRTSEIINRGGVVVAPDVIEEVLRLDPSIEDVAVVSVANAADVDEIWAAVVSSQAVDQERMIKSARTRLNERAPDRIFAVTSIPRNDNGKVMRNVVREMLRRVASAV